MSYVWEFLKDKNESMWRLSNRDYDKMLKQFGGTEITSHDCKHFNSDDFTERLSENVSMNPKTGVKRLVLGEDEDEPGYYIFMFYFR